MLLLFMGSTLSQGGKTVCGCLRTLGMKGEKAFANYHHFLSRSKIDMLQGVKVLIKMLLPLVENTVVLVVDEHLETHIEHFLLRQCRQHIGAVSKSKP